MTQSSPSTSGFSRKKNFDPATVVDFISHSASQTRFTGVALGKLAQPGDIILLAGELGAGKTTLTKGIAEGLDIKGIVNSPTFTLVNEYQGRIALYHMDCYRLESGRDALDFGVEEYLYGEGLTVIEWAERIEDILPKETLTVRLSTLNETKRGIRLEPIGERYIAFVARFKEEAFGIYKS
ncbi:tRNA (adenosine(37)-N6)-threonylcarbamoyltransferase complex ATPase subunit type 1 TsaE [Candidatus Chlorohelix sp.]|uniref:tRNA (adenosine(37)-N6)-threonylcarbamoyltransferase complex ATPase subunit type 1 TsaE n=1 Tax=Candidatus Chlorohelix sp. TaxID=3139201 RepID=UPI0031453A1E